MSYQFGKRVLFAIVALTLASFAQTSSGNFTIITLPDTQNEAQYYPQVLNTEIQWIANNAKALNIQLVIGLGDIVNNGTDTAQYNNADASYQILDQAGIPYMAPVGNHDYADAHPVNRNTTLFDQYFGPARYAGKSYYQGSYTPGSNDNFYGVFTIEGTQYLVLALEFIPRDPVLQWASTVLSQNLDKKVIVVTHGYLDPAGYRQGHCDGNAANSFEMNGDNDAQAMWSKLISQYPNIIMVMNGHDEGVSHRADLGINGNLVNQTLLDYQDLTDGGNGWLQIYTFKPASNQIDVQSYSPYLNQYLTDSNDKFSMSITNPGTSSSTGAISGLVRDGACKGISGVTITAGGKSVKTASDGSYKLTGVSPSAERTVVASGANLTSNTQTVQVDAGYTAQLHFFMVPQGAAAGLVTVSSPGRGTNVSSPVPLSATAQSSAGAITAYQVYVDNVLAYSANGPTLNTSLDMSSWGHQVTVQATDIKGNAFQQYVNVVVAPTTASSPDFSLTLTQQNSSSGDTQYLVTIAPVNGFQDLVTLSCTGLPAGNSCSFSVNPVNPASGSLTSTLVISTNSTTSALPTHRRTLLFAVALPFFALAFGTVVGRRNRKWAIALVVLALLVSSAVMIGCGSGGGTNSSQASPSTSSQGTANAQTTITVVASSGGIQHTDVAAEVD